MARFNGYAAYSADTPIRPFAFERRAVGIDDVAIDILYCGVCHSDLHMARNEWNVSRFPLVPGHEIVGRVRETGEAVENFAPGTLVGVGVMVGSCRHCDYCMRGDEQYCCDGFIATYNGKESTIGGPTYGGFSEGIVVNQHFVVPIPDGLDPAAAAPLLCAGVTVWSPLKHWDIGPGKKVGIVGLGGLGHMAIKLAAALGADVTLFTRSTEKAEDALRLGANKVVVSTNADAMDACRATLDLILDCVAAPHDLDPYLGTLNVDGTLVLAGIPDRRHAAPDVTPMVFRRLSIAGTSIGSIRETAEMLQFCAEHAIVSDIELIGPDDIENAFARMLKGDVRYRFVMSMATQDGN